MTLSSAAVVSWWQSRSRPALARCDLFLLFNYLHLNKTCTESGWCLPHGGPPSVPRSAGC